MRNKIRNLTAIESTNIITDAHINDLINQELHSLIFQFDDLEQFWKSGNNAITVTEDGVTYRVPGWRFDNTTQYPTGLYNNIYMNTDGALAPWSTVVNTTYTAGYFDLYLVYKVSSRLLAEQEDDSKRGAEFASQAEKIVNHIIAQEYIGHSADRLGALPSSDGAYDLTLIMKTALLLKIPGSFEGGSSDGFGWFNSIVLIKQEITSVRTELFNEYKWSHNNSSFANYEPHPDIFAFAVAARLGARFGLSEAEIKLLTVQYEGKKESLVKQLISNTSGYSVPSTLAQMVNQVRALLQDFTTQIPETIIKSWLNTEYQMLASEFDWPWLTSEIQATLSGNNNQINLNPYNINYGSVKNVFEVETDNSGNILDYQVVQRVPHTLDGEKNESKYRYDVDGGIITITPTPTESTKFNIRFVTNASDITLNNDTTLFEDRFHMYLIYRAAYLGSAWNVNAKNLAPMFAQEAQRIKDIMYKYYMTSASTEPFSMGENALETRKYLPQFKAL